MNDETAEILDVSDALQAPCRWCAYNGQEYWHAGTHSRECPWHHVGGGQIRQMMLQFHNLWLGSKDDLQKACEALDQFDNSAPRYLKKETQP